MQIPSTYPEFGQYVTRKELLDRVQQMNHELRAGATLKTPTTPSSAAAGSTTENDAFMSRLGDYKGNTLEEIRASAGSYEQRLRYARAGGYAVGVLGIGASFAALGYAVHGLAAWYHGAAAGGVGGMVVGLAVFAATNYAARKVVEGSNRMLEKADGHARFQTSLQAWVNFLGDERARQHADVVKMSTATLAAGGIESTTDAVRINGIWIPRNRPAPAT